MRHARLLVLALIGSLLAVACGPPKIRPVSYPNADVSCPGAHSRWDLKIVDERVSRKDGARVVTAIRDALQKSFPGCHWSEPPDPDTGTIAIEVHRFGSTFTDGSWEAAVEWSVSVRSATGAAMTEFEANEEVSRPNYQGSNNEMESESEAFRRAIERTTRGLSAVSVTENARPHRGTFAPGAPAPAPGTGMTASR